MNNLNLILNNAKNNLVTIRDFIRFAITTFTKYNLSFGHGTDNAHDEAIYLILKTLNLPIDKLEPYLDAKLLDYEIDQLIDILKMRVIQKIPAPYITNEANFLGYQFYIDHRAIIPRSYIGEILTNNQLNNFIEHPELVHNILDLCTGNGSLAIIASDIFYTSKVIATDIDRQALEVAKININNYGLDKLIELRESNLFNNLNDCHNYFDLIISNPPYVNQQGMQKLTPEYSHEPEIALFGGNDGLEIISIILKNAHYYLNNFGLLVIEMGDTQEEFEELFPDIPVTWFETTNNQGFIFAITKEQLMEYFNYNAK